MSALYHGGIPGLRVGDMIEPGHERKPVKGCPWCDARAKGEAGPGGIDGPSVHPQHVYATTHRLYAKHYASLYGRGDLYRVETVGESVRSDEDSFETYHAPALRVLSILDRAILLTMTERRRIGREWLAADHAKARALSGDVTT